MSGPRVPIVAAGEVGECSGEGPGPACRGRQADARWPDKERSEAEEAQGSRAARGH